MAGSTIAKISKRASQLYKKGGTWKQAQAKARKEYQSGKIGKVKKKRVGAVKKKRVGAVRKRRVGAVKKKTVGRTRAVGSVASHKAAAKGMIKEQLAWNLLNQSQAKTVRSRKKLAKRTAKLKKELKALS